MHGNESVKERVYTGPERLRVITGIIMCIMLAALDQTVVLPAIPQMARNLGGGAQLSWVVSAYLLSSTAVTPIYGKLSDEFGRRAVLVPALVFFLAASVFCALATSVDMLIAGRALQGVGGGALMAVAQAAVGDVVPPRERGKYQAWFAGTWSFASIAGPVAGGFITGHFSWRWIFWMNLPVGAVAIVLCIRGLAGLAPAGLKSRIDYGGAALMVVSVGAALFALSAGGVDFAWLSGQMAGILAVAVLGFLALLWQQRLVSAPLFPPALLAQPAYRNVLAISFLNSAGMFGGIFLLPLMMQWQFSLTPTQAGLAIVPFLGVGPAAAFTAGQVMRSTGRWRPPMVVGLWVAAAGCAGLMLLPRDLGIAAPIAVSAIFGLGLGAVMPPTLVASQALAARRDIGASTGTMLLFRAMGGAFGATVVGALLALGHSSAGFAAGFGACALLEAAAGLIALRIIDAPMPNALDNAAAPKIS